jgi:hypothetical protein
MYLVNQGLRLGSAGDIRLICNHDQKEPELFQFRQTFPCVWDNFKFFKCLGRVGLAIAKAGAVQHSVTIKKHRWTKRSGHFMDSHLV